MDWFTCIWLCSYIALNFYWNWVFEQRIAQLEIVVVQLNSRLKDAELS